MARPAWTTRLIAAALAALVCLPAAAEESPGTLADRDAIEAALHRYTRGLDRLDADLYVSAMAPDVVVVVGQDEFRGHDAMRAIVADEAALRRESAARGETPRQLFHMETNSSLAFTAPDRAVRHGYWLTMDGTALFDIGSSTDELRKIDGEWLIVRREIMLQP